MSEGKDPVTEALRIITQADPAREWTFSERLQIKSLASAALEVQQGRGYWRNAPYQPRTCASCITQELCLHDRDCAYGMVDLRAS